MYFSSDLCLLLSLLYHTLSVNCYFFRPLFTKILFVIILYRIIVVLRFHHFGQNFHPFLPKSKKDNSPIDVDALALEILAVHHHLDEVLKFNMEHIILMVLML